MLVIGLVVGVIIGFGIGYVMNQSQITQLQSTLSDTQSDLSESQSEVLSLQGQLAEAQINITSLETQLAQSQTTITSLESQLEAKEADYSSLSVEYEEFKSDVTSLVNSLEKKMELESQISKVWIAYERSDLLTFMQTITGLKPYVDAIGDSQLSTIHDEFLAHFNAMEYSEADLKFADLMERNSALIQSDLSDLNSLLGD
jgi:chromosome segregation ATPase